MDPETIAIIVFLAAAVYGWGIVWKVQHME